MIETITPAVCGSRRRQRIALAGFTLGAVTSALVVGALLGLAGRVLGAERGLIVVAALALVAAARESGLIRLPLPQARRQVPERWRAVLPLPVWSIGYGAGLGVGFATFQPVATFWIACAAAVALARPLPAALCFSLYGLGRALLVVWPRGDRDHPTAVVERLAARRKALARANAAALVVCAALLVAPSVAVAAPKPLGGGFDPSLSGTTVARARVVAGDRSVLVQPAGEPAVVIQDAWSPSIQGNRVAYQETGGIRVVNWRTGETLAQITGAVSKPALAWPLLAYRRVDADYERIIVEDVEAGTSRLAARAPLVDELGRPTLKGGYVAWHRAGAWGSHVALRKLASWRKRIVARSEIALHVHPAVTAWHIVWVELRSGRAYVRIRHHESKRTRTLWSLGRRDLSFWTTALDRRTAIVTRWVPATGWAALFRVRF